MKKHPLVWFYVLAFCLSWLGWLPAVFASRGFSLFAHPAFQLLLVLPAVGPGLVAMIVASSLGKGGARLLLRPLLSWRSGAVWLVVAALGPALLLILGKALTMAIGSAAAREQPGNVLAAAVAALVISLLSNT